MPTEEPQELELSPSSAPDIATMKRANPESAFDELSKEIAPILEQSKALTVADADKLAIVKVADEYRKDVKKLRCAVESRRKELVADLNKQTKEINGFAGKLWDVCEKEEERLLEIIQHAERETARIQNEKRTARTVEITPFLSSLPVMDLGTLTDEQYAAILTDAKDAHAARLAREQKAKEEAEAKAKAEAEERERIRLENIRLKQEAEEREAAAKKEREAAAAVLAEAQDKARKEAIAAQKAREEEQARFEAEAKKQREEIEAKARAERLAAEAKAKADREAADKENARLAAIAEAERQKAATAAREAREARERVEAEQRRQQDAEEARKKAEAAALAKAKRAPDKEKLLALSRALEAVAFPEMATLEGQKAMGDINDSFDALLTHIKASAQAL